MKQIMRKDNVQKLKDGISEAIVKRAQEKMMSAFGGEHSVPLSKLTVTLQKHSSLKLLSTTSWSGDLHMQPDGWRYTNAKVK